MYRFLTLKMVDGHFVRGYAHYGAWVAVNISPQPFLSDL